MTFDHLEPLIMLCAWYWVGVAPLTAVLEVLRVLALCALMAIGWAGISADVWNRWGEK